MATILGILTGGRMEEPDKRDAFHEQQDHLDRANWVGRGCTLPFPDTPTNHPKESDKK